MQITLTPEQTLILGGILLLSIGFLIVVLVYAATERKKPTFVRCVCKKPKLTRSVNADNDQICGKCGKPIPFFVKSAMYGTLPKSKVKPQNK